MKSILAGVAAFLLSIFGGHQVATNSASQSASVAMAVTNTMPVPSPSTVVSTTSTISPTTIINRTIIEQASSTVTEEVLNARLQSLADSLKSRPASVVYLAPSVSGAGAPLSAEAFAPSQAIDRLTNATLNNVTVNGVSGLTAADIPSLSGTYLPLTGGALTGDLALMNATSSNLGVTGIASTSALVVSGSFTLRNVTGFLKATGGIVATSLVNLASDVTGILPVANGGTGVAAIASGFIPFGNGSNAIATSASFSWNSVANSLSIGNTSITDKCPVVIGPNSICVKAPPYYASGSSATTTTSGTTSSGSASVVVSDASSFAVNQGIYVAGAGTSGADYIGTVSAITGNTLTITPVTGTTVSNGTLVQHDDTTAFQTAITSFASTGGTIYVPLGFFRLNGPLQDPSGANAILTLPSIAYVTTPLAAPISIKVVGAAPATPDSSSGSILQTSGTSGNLIAGYHSDSGFGTFTNVFLTLQNLVFRSYDNPSIAMVNANNVVSLTIDNLVFDTGLSPVCGYGVGGCTVTAPTHSGAAALIMPGLNNSATDEIKNVVTYGYYTGILAQEHANIDNFYCTYSHDCLVAQSIVHPIYVGRIATEHSTNGISAGSGPTRIYVAEWSSENSVTTNLYDPNNYLEGSINYAFSDGPYFVGGANLKLTDLVTLSRSGLFGTLRWVQGSFAEGLHITQGVTALLENQVLSITPLSSTSGSNNFNGYYTSDLSNFTGHSVSVRAPVVVGGTPNAIEYFFVGISTTQFVGIKLDGGGTISIVKDGTNVVTSRAYSSATDLYWRIREISGTLYVDTSDDGSTWVNLGSTTVTWSYTSGVEITLLAGTGASVANPGRAQFDQFSVDAAGSSNAVSWLFSGSSIYNPSNVGVGTSTPWGKFSINLNNGETNTQAFVIASSTGAVTSTLLAVTNTGRVGLGTASPNTNLQVSANGGSSFFGDGSATSVYTSYNGRAFVGYTSAAPDGLNLQSPAGKGIVFSVNNSTFGFGAAAVLTSAGNFGIGTTSPTTALQVNGVITPNTDNTSSLGNATYRWSAVYSANGTIQTSDARLKNNVTDLNYGLADLLKLRPVSFTWIAQPGEGTQLGFIAQEVQPIFPEVVNVGDDPNHTLGITYTEFVPVIVKSIQQIATVSGTFEQNLVAWLGNASNGVGDLFANNVHASNELCVGSVCVTPAQFQEMVAAAGQSSVKQSPSGPDNSTSTSTPPVIQINGDNPAYIVAGATYNDLGATVTAPQADLNLGINTFLNGALTSDIIIDTSTVATDTIDYVATDDTGNTATSTRTVIIQSATIAPSDATTTTQ